MQDLFDKTTKEEQLKNWMKQKGFVSTAEIMQYAVNNYYLRSKRTINDLVKKNLVRIVPKDECIFRGLRGKMRFYEWRG
jgi:hypothetical protein